MDATIHPRYNSIFQGRLRTHYAGFTSTESNLTGGSRFTVRFRWPWRISAAVSADDSVSVLIPPGVAHGFLALEDAGLMYAVDRYYDGSDEQGVTWNDPDLSIPWKTGEPILSERDRSNPTVAALEKTGFLP